MVRLSLGSATGSSSHRRSSAVSLRRQSEGRKKSSRRRSSKHRERRAKRKDEQNLHGGANRRNSRTSTSSSGSIRPIHSVQSILSSEYAGRPHMRAQRSGTFWQVANFALRIAKSNAEEVLSSGLTDPDIIRQSQQESMVINEKGTDRLFRLVSSKTTGMVLQTAKAGNGVDSEIVQRVSLENQREKESCEQFPSTIFFFLIFMLFFQQFYGVTEIFLAEAPLRETITSPSTGVSKPMEIYSWMEADYFPNLWSDKQGGKQSPYQRTVWGVRLMTTRAKQVPCDDNGVIHITCFTGNDPGKEGDAFPPLRRRLEETPAHNSSSHQSGNATDLEPGSARNEEEQASTLRKQWRRRLRPNRPELRDYIPEPSSNFGMKSTLIVPVSHNLSDVIDLLKRMETARVIRNTTLTFSLQALVENKQLGIPLLSQLDITFSMHRGGDVFAQVSIITLKMETMGNEQTKLLGPLWIFVLAYLSCILSVNTVFKWKQGKFWSHFIQFWNMMEWLIIIGGWAIVTIFIVERLQIQTLKRDLESFSPNAAGQASKDVSEDDLDKLLNKAELACDISAWIQICVANYHILLVFRYFMAVRGQPRLAVVLNTIRKASGDLLHLLLVIFLIFVGYAISGHILFGKRMEEFATLRSSFAKCFEIVMEREYNWDKFTEQDWGTCTVWVWSFLVLVVLVLVNIFLAMVFESYGQVRNSVGDSATLLQTTLHKMTEMKYLMRLGSDKWISNHEVITAIQKMQCQNITPWMMKDAIPNITNQQVNYLFNLAYSKVECSQMQSEKNSMQSSVASTLIGISLMYGELLRMLDSYEKAGIRISAERKNDVHIQPPDDPPSWVKVQLLPHINKQATIFDQVHQHIFRIESVSHACTVTRGVVIPSDVQVPHATFPGRPPRPSRSVSPNQGIHFAVSPATKRAGLTGIATGHATQHVRMRTSSGLSQNAPMAALMRPPPQTSG